MPRSRNGKLWKYFTVDDHDEKTATCHACSKSLSFKTTITNLRHHLRHKHKELLEELLNGEDTPASPTSPAQEEEDSEEEAPSSLWSYFERSGPRARCAVCRASVPRRADALRDHLMQHHPKLLPKDQSQDSDPQEDDSDMFTEVIYLEESPKSEEPRKPRKKYEYERKSSWRPRSPIESNFQTKKRKSSPPPQVQKKSPGDEEIESFGAYITCLLKSLPKDVCSAVQRDIIALIVNAKINKPEETENTPAPVPVILKAQGTKNFIVIESKELEKTGQSAEESKIQYSIKVATDVNKGDIMNGEVDTNDSQM